MLVYQRIAAYLKQAGLKQYVVANKAGYTAKQFSAMMTGKRKVYADDLARICAALDKEPNDFVKIESHKNSA